MKRDLNFFLGMIFTILGIASIIIHIIGKNWYDFFWFSNHWALLIGIAFLTRSSFIFTYSTILGIIPEMFWNVDFLYLLSGGHNLLGITNYWFVTGYPTSPQGILALQHLINPFIALWGIKRMGGAHKKAWKGAITHGLILIGLGYIISPIYKINLNCALHNCLPSLPIPDIFWRIAWPIFMIGIILLLQNVIKKIFPKQR